MGLFLTIRLAGLLGSPSLAPTKLDELKVKINILGSFAAKKAGQAVEAAGDLAEDAKEAVKDTYDQAVEGVEAFAAMMDEKTGGKLSGEL